MHAQCVNKIWYVSICPFLHIIYIYIHIHKYYIIACVCIYICKSTFTYANIAGETHQVRVVPYGTGNMRHVLVCRNVRLGEFLYVPICVCLYSCSSMSCMRVTTSMRLRRSASVSGNRKQSSRHSRRSRNSRVSRAQANCHAAAAAALWPCWPSSAAVASASHAETAQSAQQA